MSKEEDGLQTVPVHELVIEQLGRKDADLGAIVVFAKLYAEGGYCPPEAIPALVDAFYALGDIGRPRLKVVQRALDSLQQQARQAKQAEASQIMLLTERRLGNVRRDEKEG